MYIWYSSSKAFHSLVDLALNNGSSSDAESKEEALTIYQDICDIIENRAKVTNLNKICHRESKDAK